MGRSNGVGAVSQAHWFVSFGNFQVGFFMPLFPSFPVYNQQSLQTTRMMSSAKVEKVELSTFKLNDEMVPEVLRVYVY